MSRGNRMGDAEDARPASVYRIFDKDGQLIYVGCAVDVASRIHTHRSFWSPTPGCDLIYRGYDHHDEAQYPTRVEARAAERLAIREQGPWVNRHHNPTRWRRGAKGYEPVDPKAYAEYALSILGPRPRGPFGSFVHDEYLAMLGRAS